MKNLIVLCIATCIFKFSIIVINFAPYISGLVGKDYYDKWFCYLSDGFVDYQCSRYTDWHNDYKDGDKTFSGNQ